MSKAVEVVYQVVMPGDPDENARCCLYGVRLDGVEVGGTGADVEDGAVLDVVGTEEVTDMVGTGRTADSVEGPPGGGGWLEELRPLVNC